MKSPEFSRRRRAIMRMVGNGGAVILPAAIEKARNRDTHYVYRQDSDFYYLTGFTEPDAVAVLIPGRPQGEYLMFCRERDPDRELWDGSRAGQDGVIEHYGADDAFPIDDIDDIIPGLIEGAAEGTGLGIQFLKHLQRTRLLLHLVDLAPLALDVDPVSQVRQLEEEMRKFDAGLADKPRWLVFTKADLMPADEARTRAEEAVAELGWEAPWMLISSVTKSGTDELMQRVSDELERIAEDEAQALAEQEAGL